MRQKNSEKCFEIVLFFRIVNLFWQNSVFIGAIEPALQLEGFKSLESRRRENFSAKSFR